MGPMDAIIKSVLRSMGFEPNSFIEQANTFVRQVSEQIISFDRRITVIESDIAEIKRLLAENRKASPMVIEAKDTDRAA
jgi:hypothetical protein